MKESMGYLIKAVDAFGFLTEDFGFDLLSYEYSRTRSGYFKMILESRSLRLSLTLEKGQLYIHFGAVAYPDEWHSMLRIVRLIARKGGRLTNDEQDTDYWRHGMKLESQFEIAARQLEKTLPTITAMFTGTDLEATREDLKNYRRLSQQEAVAQE
jgi:hypothetical protein